MSVLQKTLNTYVPWTYVLGLCGVEVGSQSLPQRTTCPVCQGGRCLILPDRNSSGQWYYCPDCPSAGDMIHLASRYMKLDIPASIIKLAAGIPSFTKTSPENIENYLLRKRLRDSVTDYWNQHRSYEAVMSVPNISEMYQKLHLRCDSYGEWFDRGPAQIMGAGMAADINQAFRPNDVNDIGRGDKVVWDTQGSATLFRGKKWRGVIFVPFFDLPGRICAYWCAGRQMVPGEDEIFRHTSSAGERPEAGLALHPKLMESSVNTVFAFPGPVPYLQIQMRHFRESKKLLPVVSWYGDTKQRTKHGWAMLAGKEIIFWAQKWDHELLYQLKRTNGKLYLTKTADKDLLSRQLTKFSPVQLLHRFKKYARPWNEALDIFVRSAADHEIENLFLRYKGMGQDPGAILLTCSNKTKDKVRTLLSDQKVGCGIRINSRERVEERANGWWRVALETACDESLISDATVRIQRVILLPVSGQTLYKGYIQFKGRKLPFCEDRNVVEKKAFRWVQDKLLEARYGICTYNRAYNAKMCSIALLFHSPEMETGIESVGWDNERAELVLPEYKIDKDGVVTAHDGFIARRLSADIPFPAPLDKAVLEPLLTPTQANKLFWASWCALVANILAPAFGFPTRNIALVGPSTEPIAALAAHAAGVLKIARKDLEAGQWPVMMSGQCVGDITVLDNVMRRTTHQTAATCLLRGGWHVVHCAARIKDELPVPALEILPAYLVDVLSRKREIVPRREMVTTIMADVIGWLERQGLSAEVVREARKSVWVNGRTHASFFAYLIGHAAQAGLTRFVPSGFVEGQDVIVDLDGNSYFISRYLFRTLLERLKLPSVPSEEITEHLSQVKALLGDIELDGQIGWVVKADWLNDQLNRWRMKNTLRIRKA